MRYVFGITGSIACGKSYVTSYLKNKGFNVIDTDLISKEITKKGNIGYFEVIKKFPYLDSNNELDRKKLASVIFSDSRKREELNSILHPIIYKECQNEIQKLDGVIFLDVPLLFETNFDTLCDKTICVWTNKDTQLKRLMMRDNLSYDDALKRISSQMDIETKKKKSDYLIESMDDFNDTNKNIEKMIQIIKEKQYV